MAGLPLSFFIVCVPKKRAWKHIGTLEWKWKRKVAPVPSEMVVRSLAQEEGVIHIILTWFCFHSFFFTIPSRFFSYQSRIEHAEKNLLHVKTVRFRSGKRILGNHVLWLESVVNPISDRSS